MNTIPGGGHNALDFHTTYYLGRLAAADPAGCFYIISKDTGFDSLIEHMNKAGVKCDRAISIESLLCVDAISLAAGVGTADWVKAPKANSAIKKKTAELVELVFGKLFETQKCIAAYGEDTTYNGEGVVRRAVFR